MLLSHSKTQTMQITFKIFFLIVISFSSFAQNKDDAYLTKLDSLKKIYDSQIIRLTTSGKLTNAQGETFKLTLKENTRRLFQNSEPSLILFDKYVQQNKKARLITSIGSALMIGSAFLIKEKPEIAGIGIAGGFGLSITGLIKAFKAVPVLEQAIDVRNRQILFPK